MENSETKIYSDYELQKLNEELLPYFEDVHYERKDEKRTIHTLTRRGVEKFLCDKGVAEMEGVDFILIKNRIYGDDGYEALDEKIRQWDEWRSKKNEVENLENFKKN